MRVEVVITEGVRTSLVSQAIAWRTESWATHAFVAFDRCLGVEAHCPVVRCLDVKERLDRLRCSDRAYVIMSLLDVPLQSPTQALIRALGFTGRTYDVGQAVLFLLMGTFWNGGAMVCSKLVTDTYASIGENLFPESVLEVTDRCRIENIRKGYIVPHDLLQSRLTAVEFYPSSRVRTVSEF